MFDMRTMLALSSVALALVGWALLAKAGVTVLMGKPYTEQDLIVHVARLAGVSLDG